MNDGHDEGLKLPGQARQTVCNKELDCLSKQDKLLMIDDKMMNDGWDNQMTEQKDNELDDRQRQRMDR